MINDNREKQVKYEMKKNAAESFLGGIFYVLFISTSNTFPS